MIRSGESPLEAASQRLTRAMQTLEERLQNRPAEASGGTDAGSGEAEAALRAELDAAREREKALEQAAAEASAALGRAAEQIRVALEEEEA